MFDRFIGWLQGLSEAGRVLNSRNAARMQQIHDHAATMLEMGCAPGKMQEAWRSFGENSDAVRNAIAELLGDDCGCYIRDMWDDKAVYACYGRTEGTYEVSYTIDADGKVTLGTPVMVRPVTTYEPVPASLIEPPEPSGATGPMLDESARTLTGDCVPLVEKAVASDGTIPIKIIAPGWGSSGYYAESVLRRDIPQAFPAGTKMYWNHPTLSEATERPERDLRDLAAKTVSAPIWRADGPAGPGMYADAKVYEGYAPAVNDLAADIGLSIVAAGYAKTGEAEGRSGPIIEKIVRGESIDFVTTPGAGGKILTQFAEAARSRAALPQEDDPMEIAELKRRMEALEAENARLKEAQTLARARGVASAALDAHDLLPTTRERVLAEALRALPLADGALDETALAERARVAAERELAYLAEAAGTGRIVGMGGTAPAALTEADIESALAGVFGAIGLSESGAKVAARGR